MYKRLLEKRLKELDKTYPAVALTGLRQSGKTTLVKEIFSSTHEYMNLENLDQRDFAQNDPRAFLQDCKKCLILSTSVKKAFSTTGTPLNL